MQPTQFFLVVGIATAFRAIPQFGKGHHSSFATTITRNSHIEIPERAIYPATSSPFLERLESMKQPSLAASMVERWLHRSFSSKRTLIRALTTSSLNLSI